MIKLVGTSTQCRIPSAYIGSAGTINTQTYTYRVPPPGDIEFTTGLSIPLLLTHVGIALPKVSNVEVTGGITPTPSNLSTEDMNDVDTVFVQGAPPVLYISGTYIWYARQQRVGGPLDTGLEDQINSNTNDITLAVTAGTVEPVTIAASTKNPKSGGSVTFTAAAPKIPHAQYIWTFGDGTAATKASSTASATHSFTGNGASFVVTVNVTGDGGLNGAQSVTIVAGTKPPPKSTKPKPGTGKSTKKTAPSTGPATGSGNRVGATVSSTPSTSTSLTKGAQSTKSGLATNQTQLNAESALDSLPLVSGRLIGGITQTISAKSLGQQETATAPAARIPPKWRLPLSLGAAAVVVLLLLAGAGSEARPARRRRRT